MHGLFLRQFLLFGALLCLVVAIAQVSGRVGVLFIDQLEEPLNGVLSEMDFGVQRLSGRWSKTNPVLQVGNLSTPFGDLTNITIEIDWLESLLLNRFVASKLIVEDGLLHFDYLPDNSDHTNLKELMSAIAGLVYHSDQIKIDFRVLALSDRKPLEYSIDYLALNENGTHHHQLSIRADLQEALINQSKCLSDCSLFADFYHSDGKDFFKANKLRLIVRSEQLPVPASLFGLPDFIIDKLDFVLDSSSAVLGEINLSIDEIEFTEEVAGRLDLTGGIREIEDDLRGSLEVLSMGYRNIEKPGIADTWSSPEILIKLRGNSLELWVEELDLTTSSAFLRGGLSAAQHINNPFDRLGVKGLLEDGWFQINTQDRSFNYSGVINSLSTNAWNGIPEVIGGRGRFFGYENGAQFILNSPDLFIRFPRTFPEGWALGNSTGVLRAWFKDGYLGLEGQQLAFSAPDSKIEGQFSLARNLNDGEGRLTVLADVNAISFSRLFTYLPETLPPDINNWLRVSLVDGRLEGARFAYRGDIDGPRRPFSNRLALEGKIQDANLRYHERWPEINELFGHLSVSGSAVNLDVHDAKMLEHIELSGTTILYNQNDGYVDVLGSWDVATSDALRFFRSTPIIEELPFLSPDWFGDGLMIWSGGASIPFREGEGQNSISVEMQVDMREVGLNIPRYSLNFSDLSGQFNYRYPISFEGTGIQGFLFGKELRAFFLTDGFSTVLNLSGSGGHADVERVPNLGSQNWLNGSAQFDSSLIFSNDINEPAQLNISSSMSGFEVTLPFDLDKKLLEEKRFNGEIRFQEGFDELAVRYGPLRAWVHIAGEDMRGAVGFNADPLDYDDQERWNYFFLNGALGSVSLADFNLGGLGGVNIPPLKVFDMQVEGITFGPVRFSNSSINGEMDDTGFRFSVAGPEVQANLVYENDDKLFLSFDSLKLPAFDVPVFGEQIPGSIPEIEVSINNLYVGDSSYGQLRFNFFEESNTLYFKEIDALVRGLRIESKEGLIWNLNSNESRFSGNLSAQKLIDVLPLWGYFPTLDAEEISGSLSISWVGNPLELSLSNMVGNGELKAANGRFVEIDSGGSTVRILSLINFNAITKRLRGDFSDVTGKGLAFDDLTANAEFSDGILIFSRPLEIKGTGSSFEVNGTVDLNTGILNNEMVVTLPVTKSLPWYGLYLALANPLAGAGVIVGERVLRKPIEQVSSARYSLKGTLDNPELLLLDVVEPSNKGSGSIVEPPISNQSELVIDSVEGISEEEQVE